MTSGTLSTIARSELPPGFASDFQGTHGERLHYVVGGEGDPVLLVPGWPQSWYAWRKIMPALAAHYMVVAVDPPGLGHSDKPPGGYDTKAVAARLHEFVAVLGWEDFHFVGHDIGCWIGRGTTIPILPRFPQDHADAVHAGGPFREGARRSHET